MEVFRLLPGFVRRFARRTYREFVNRASIGSELCPYCFDYFKMSATPFRCSTPVCKKEVDTVLAAKWRDTAPKGKVLSGTSYSRARTCPDCKGETKARLCPHCHQELPHTIGEFRNLVISLVGAKNAGKSHYLPALIENLRNVVGPDLRFQLQPLNEEATNRYNANYRDPLLKEHRLLPTTRSALAEMNTRLPLVFRLAFYQTDRNGHRDTINLVTLAFFDTAGEDMNSDDTLAYVNKYIFRSDGIILLLDPLQLDFVRDRAGSPALLPERDVETTDIVARLDRLIHAGRGIGADAPIEIPLAIALSKFDALDGLVDAQLVVRQASAHVGGVDTGDFRTVDAEVQSHLDHWGEQGLLEQIRSGFRQHSFFGVTALGSAPSKTSVVNLRPKRVADPFLWILYRHGLVKAKPEKSS